MTQLLGVFLTKPVSVTPYLLEKWTKKLQDCYLLRFKIIPKLEIVNVEFTLTDHKP